MCLLTTTRTRGAERLHHCIPCGQRLAPRFRRRSHGKRCKRECALKIFASITCPHASTSWAICGSRCWPNAAGFDLRNFYDFAHPAAIYAHGSENRQGPAKGGGVAI